MEMKVDIQGREEVQALFVRLRDKLEDLQPFLKVAGLVVLESVNRNFMAGGRPAWVALSPTTIKRRGGKAQPLRDTGLLMASISPGAPDGWYKLTPESVEVGTTVPYAGAQQFGTKDGHVPARPFMVVQPEDEDVIVQVALDEIDKAIKGNA
jgi:phage gpG-like protein